MQDDDGILIELAPCKAGLPKMLSLGTHLYELGEFLRFQEIEQLTVAGWLQIAAGIGAVDVDLMRRDGSMFMCGQAARYY